MRYYGAGGYHGYHGGRGGFRGRFGRGRWGRWGRHWPGRWHGPFGGAPDPQVQWAQGCLAQVVDPAVPQNGIMGPQTRQAIQSFQSQQQMPPTGMLDEGTVSALQAACNPQPPAPPPPPPPLPPPQNVSAPPPGQGAPSGGGGGGGRRSQQPQQEAFLGDIFGGGGLPIPPLFPPIPGLFGSGSGGGAPQPPSPPPFFPERDHWHGRWPHGRRGRWMHEAEAEAEFPFFGGERFEPFRHDRWRWERHPHRPWMFDEEAEVRGGARPERPVVRTVERPAVRVERPVVRVERPVVRFDRPRFERPFGRPGFGFRPGARFFERDRWNWRHDRWFPRREGWHWDFGAPEAGPPIAWAQSCLAQVLGPWVVQDGILGPATRRALRAYQEQQQLAPTGVLDEPTVNALQSACGSPMPV